jgi:mRNA interferase MazF
MTPSKTPPNLAIAPIPKRGEVWWIDFEPTIGQEINKTRPAVIISANGIGKLDLRLVVPLTKWQEAFANNIWHVFIPMTKENGLKNDSTADALQVRSISNLRFERHAGNLTDTQLDEIARAIAAVVKAPSA